MLACMSDTEEQAMKRIEPLKTVIAAGLIVTVIMTLAPRAAEAHHSFAMYDRTKSETLTGRLTRFIPGANHAQMIFELVGPDGEAVLGEDGQPVVWGFETARAAAIAQRGVTVRSFPVGTIITVTVNPLRDGRTFGVLSGGIIRCGMELPDGGCNEQTGELFMTPAPD